MMRYVGAMNARAGQWIKYDCRYATHVGLQGIAALSVNEWIGHVTERNAGEPAHGAIQQGARFGRTP